MNDIAVGLIQKDIFNFLFCICLMLIVFIFIFSRILYISVKEKIINFIEKIKQKNNKKGEENEVK